MGNKRNYYAILQTQMASDGIEPTGFGDNDALRGVQNVGLDVNFNLEQVFQQGIISIYENIEGLPDVQVSIERVLDGNELAYLKATQDAVGNSLAARSNAKCALGIAIFSDTLEQASGQPVGWAYGSGLFCSNLTYTFPVEGNFSESVTLVGNHLEWHNEHPTYGLTDGMTGVWEYDADNTPSPPGAGGVNRREDLIYGYDYTWGTGAHGYLTSYSGTILPSGMPGISASGENLESDGAYGASVQNITVSTDLGRTELFELGRRGPYHRYVNFPVEVSCDIEIIEKDEGALVSATEAGILGNGNNISESVIQVHAREGTVLFLGTKNQLQTSSRSGGGTDGGNVSVTYSYLNYNDLYVSHDGSAIKS